MGYNNFAFCITEITNDKYFIKKHEEESVFVIVSVLVEY